MNRSRRPSVTARTRARKASEFARCYLSPERVAFVAGLNCAVPSCGSIEPKHKHHVKGDGAHRKGGYAQIIPLCQAHHVEWHYAGRVTFAERYKIDADRLAARTESQWAAHLNEETDQ